MTAPRKATRTDVARLAETSVAVVSYVINNGPRGVSPERRRRVLKAMEQLQYQPNAIARSLTSTRTNTIGMVVPNIFNAFFAELSLAVEEAARSAGKLLFLGNSNEELEREHSYVESFLRQQVDAVIIVGVAQDTSIRLLDQAGVPVVVLDRPIDADNAVNVGIDNDEAAMLATRHLIEHEHRRIACLTGPTGLAVAEDRLRGYRRAIEEIGAVDDDLVFRSLFTLEGGRDVTDDILRARSEYTALFVASDEQARGVLSAAASRGVRVPQDLAIVSVDGTRQSDFTWPPLTSVRQPVTKLASVAVAAASGEPRSPTTLRGSLHIGQSCGCVQTELTTNRHQD